MTVTTALILLAIAVALWTLAEDYIVRNGPPGPPPRRKR